MDSIIDYVFTKLREQGRLLLHNVFPYHHIQTMILICLVQIITVQRLFTVLPVFVCYFSFLSMVYYTLQMFHSRFALRRMETWKRLLQVRFISIIFRNFERIFKELLQSLEFSHMKFDRLKIGSKIDQKI